VYSHGRDINDGRVLRALTCPNHGAFGVRDENVVLVEPIADPDDV
jgi:hypothetical protein